MKRRTKADVAVSGAAYIIVALLCLTIIFPVWNMIVISFNESLDTMKGGLGLLPRRFTLENYKAVFSDMRLYRSFAVTVGRTVVTTFSSVIFTAIFAYGVSRKELKFRKTYMKLCTFTMYFSAGTIPAYILMKELNLINSYLVYVLPYLFSAWNMIIFRSFFQGIPDSLIEAARIDGAGEYRIFFTIIVPASTPVIATISLFTAVGQWNTWLDSVIYMTDSEKLTLAAVLRQIISSRSMLEQEQMRHLGSAANLAESTMVSTRSLSASTMIVSMLPIIMVYPFVQKYFVGGMMIGAVKG